MEEAKLWAGIAMFFAALVVFEIVRPRLVLALFTARRQARDFWLRALIERGPMPLSKLPTWDERTLPVEKYRRAGLIEIDPSGSDPVIHASGYARMLISSASP